MTTILSGESVYVLWVLQLHALISTTLFESQSNHVANQMLYLR